MGEFPVAVQNTHSAREGTCPRAHVLCERTRAVSAFVSVLVPPLPHFLSSFFSHCENFSLHSHSSLILLAALLLFTSPLSFTLM